MRSSAKLAGAALLATACGCSASPPAGHAATDRQNFATIERGRYMAVVADCAACHTMPGSGQQWAGGRPIETPFGKLLAPNITPDRETGIGAWSDDAFVGSLLNGTGRGGEHLYPAMPYPYFTRMTRDDALAIRAYLNTVPAVSNRVVSNQLPFPLDIRASLIAWNALFFKPGRFQPRQDKSAEWNRGAYLVEGPDHCGACHTPKNLLGADKSSEALQGYSLQGWFAPALTNDAYRGLGGWSIDQIVAYLKTGHNDTAAAAGPMAEEVALSSSQMTDADLRATATYLKDQPDSGPAKPAPVAASDPAMKVGSAIYTDECAACHAPTGSGIAGLFPTLAGSPSVQSREPTSLLHVLLVGARSVGTQGAPTAAAMPPFRWLLKDDEVAAVATYVRNAWGNAAPAVSTGDVSQARRTLARASN
ncbi:c-type cytochrome [Rhodopila sp.]|uniref:c-type cytochrome n=1 Tax=Rhodopila sp. TaxID=2480087 RepID=UPI003D1428E7